jgi:ABC-2 type transport system ATP-binding protein
MLQHSVLYKNLTVWENLDFASSIYGVAPPRGKRLRQVLDFVELAEHGRKPVRNISGGMQRRLSLAAALVHEPELLFLDEPTAGIDPVLRRKFWQQFHALRDQGRTLLVTTQYVGEATYCDVVAILEAGRLLFMETPPGLRRRAFGGDAVDIRCATPLGSMALEQLWELAPVRDVITVDEATVRLIVDEAETAIPTLLAWSQEQSAPVESIQEYLPPFDDIFVTLIEGRQEKLDGS